MLMKKSVTGCIMIFFTLAVLPAASAVPEEIPVSGKKTRNVELVDAVMLKYLKRIGCTTATICIARGDKVLVSRSYGWVDKERTRPAPPDVMMSLASCDKPILSAAVKHLDRKGKLDVDTPVLEFFNVKPAGPVVDPRVYDITLDHLTKHKAGWGKNPLARVPEKMSSNVENLSQIATCRLLHDPGTTSAYCNYGFGLLNAVILQASGLSSGEYFEKELPGIEGTFNYNQSENFKNGKSAWNAGAHGTSAPVLCQFMNHYWMSGARRYGGNRMFSKYGSWPNCTSMMLWRPQLNIAVIFNGRKRGCGHGAIIKDLKPILGKVQ